MFAVERLRARAAVGPRLVEDDAVCAGEDPQQLEPEIGKCGEALFEVIPEVAAVPCGSSLAAEQFYCAGGRELRLVRLMGHYDVQVAAVPRIYPFTSDFAGFFLGDRDIALLTK